MKFRNILGAIAIGWVLSVGLIGCNKEEVDPGNPVISDLKVGLEDSKVAYIGQDLVVEAQLEAPAIIYSVGIEIHPLDEQEWSFSQTYTEGLTGALSASFLENISIPEEAEAGNYQLYLTLMDQTGYSIIVVSELELKVTEPEESDEE